MAKFWQTKFNLMMNPTYIFLADGFEEVEALATLDVMRRGGMNVITVSINSDKNVTGAHGVTVVADALLDEVSMASEPARRELVKSAVRREMPRSSAAATSVALIFSA